MRHIRRGRFRNRKKTGCNGRRATIRCFPTSWRLKMMGHYGSYVAVVTVGAFTWSSCVPVTYSWRSRAYTFTWCENVILADASNGVYLLKGLIRKNLKHRSPSTHLSSKQLTLYGMSGYVFWYMMWHNWTFIQNEVGNTYVLLLENILMEMVSAEYDLCTISICA